MAISQNQEARKLLAVRIYRDFNALKTYGKEPESLKSIISLFNETLADYGFEEINQAMTEHVKQSPEFPTPHDIVKLINLARAQEARDASRITLGVDDTIEKLREYDKKKRSGIRLTPKEVSLLRDYGWKLVHDN